MEQQQGKRSRGNGEGSIRKKKDGRWEARVTIGRNDNGSQKMKYLSGKTRQEAAEKLNIYINESKKGTYIEPNRYTLSAWLDEWYENYVVNKVKTTTRANYYNMMKFYIRPNLGHYKLRELKSSTIQGFYNTLAVEGRKRGKQSKGFRYETIKVVHRVLRNALQAAYLNELIAKNPAAEKRVSLPQKGIKNEIMIFTKNREIMF